MPASDVQHASPAGPRSLVVSAAVAECRPQKEQEARTRALSIFADLANDYFGTAVLIRDVLVEEGPLSAASPSLAAMFMAKSTGTLIKRSISLRQYQAWFCTTEFIAQQFFSEPAAFAYVTFLYTNRAPATRAASFREACNMVGTVFGVDAVAIRSSSRVHGLTCRQLRQRAEVRQRAPFTVQMVKTFETILLKEALRHTDDAVIAGAACFAIFARARIGDLRKCQVEPVLDLAKDNVNGFLETRFRDHKTARPGSRSAMPITAPMLGVLDEPWGPAWRAVRASLGLDAAAQQTLLPARGANGWLAVHFTTTEFASAFRALLLRHGYTHAQLVQIGAHSCKITTLAWLARYGAAKEPRKMLGYHALREDKAMDSYSRDSMAGPLRILTGMLTDIREHRFDPDSTRSGAFPVAAPPAPSSSSSSSSCSSASPVVSEDEFETEANSVVLNERTGFYHRVESNVLVCGKPMPSKAIFLPAVPSGGRLCSRCF